MKRTNVILDEKLLEEARQLTGERTYSSTINRALDEMVRRQKVSNFVERMAKGDFFRPGYAEEVYGEEWVREVREKLEKKYGKPRRRAVAALDVAVPKKRRGTRR